MSIKVEGTQVMDEAIEAVLDGTGWPWSRRSASWLVALTPRLPREVRVVPAEAGARVETTLADWDELPAVCREALRVCLVAAQPGLRFARCELDERQARLTCDVAAERLDDELPQALLGVAAGCELMAREVEALQRPELAEMYTRHRRMLPETPGETPRNVPEATGRGTICNPREPEGR
jgi:hypothetical protein